MSVFEMVTEYIWKMGMAMIAITLTGIAMNIMLGYFTSRITTNIVADVRDDLFEKVQGYSHTEYEKIGVSSLITRVTNDAYQIMLFLQNILRIGLMTPMMFAVSLYMVMRTSTKLGMYVLGALPILLIAVIAIAKISEPLSNKQQANLDKINGILRENLSGLRVIRAFVNEKFEEKRFSKVNQAYASSSHQLVPFDGDSTAGLFLLIQYRDGTDHLVRKYSNRKWATASR